MQSYEGDKLVSTDTGTLKQLFERAQEIDGQILHHVIGKLPSKGEVVTINGLRYKVASVDGVEGKLRLRILRTKR